LFLHEIQKIPLRHQADEFAPRRQVSEIRNHHGFTSDLCGQLTNFLMLTL